MMSNATTMLRGARFLLGALLAAGCGAMDDEAPALDLSQRHVASGKADGSRKVWRVGETLELVPAGPSFTLRFTVRAEVANLAWAKRVGIVYAASGGSWKTAEGHWTDGERWSIPLELPASGFTGLQYAIWYQVSGQTHWDNNAGRDYHVLGRSRAGVTTVLTPAAPVGPRDKAQVTIIYSTHTKAGSPSAFVRLSTDGWKTSTDVTASPIYAGLGSTPGAGAVAVGWPILLGPFALGTRAELSTAVVQAGQQHWGTAFGQNLVIEPECVSDCLAEAASWSYATGDHVVRTASAEGWTFLAGRAWIRGVDPAGKLAWSVSLPEADVLGILQPVGQRLYYSLPGSLVALDRTSGKPIFSYPTGGSYAYGDRLLAGAAQLAFVTRAANDSTRLHAISLAGASLWWSTVDVGAALVPGSDDVIVATEKRDAGHTLQSLTLRRLAAKNGATVWKATLSQPSGASNSSWLAAVGPDGTSYVLWDGALVALADGGAIRWQVPVASTSAGGGVRFLADGTVVYQGSALVGLRPTDGKILWTTVGPGGSLLGPQVAEDAVFVVAPEGNQYPLLRLDGASGATVWKQAGAGIVQSEGLLLRPGTADAVFVSTRMNYSTWPPRFAAIQLHRIALSSGAPLWSLRLGENLPGVQPHVPEDYSPVPRIVGGVGGVVYLLRQGVLYALTI